MVEQVKKLRVLQKNWKTLVMLEEFGRLQAHVEGFLENRELIDEFDEQPQQSTGQPGNQATRPSGY
jgi:hypothetical protein